MTRRTFLLSKLCGFGCAKNFLFVVYLALSRLASAQIDFTISEQQSKSVVLPCPVNEAKCGKLHSLNWFRGDDRIAAMLLGEQNVTSVNRELEKRVTVESNPYRLIIHDLEIGDEDVYLCDTTFFIPEETCDNFNGYRIELRVLVPPTEIVILDAKGDRVENGSIVGPMQERQPLKATCMVKNTRPQPDVGWFRGTKRLTTYSPTHDLIDGLYSSTLELDWVLSREDLAHDIECRVKSAAIEFTIVKSFSVDLQVRPTNIEINGVEHHTVQGSKVVLTCDIHGARPAVNLTWYNNTIPITIEENQIIDIRTKALENNDGTYHTQSELIFNASRFENDRVFRCEAENIVLKINREKPISSSLTLEVLYPPVVKVSPPDMLTNTSEIVLLNCEYVANPASLTHVVWYRNNDVVNINDTDHYQGGNSENVALVIKSTDKEDSGNYSCQLSNTIGKGTSEQEISLDVQYVPTVEIVMIPEGPVKENDESNVTLICNILDANPSVLTKVRWYANSTLLKELPDCEETNEDLCHIDPSKLLLESIGRGFFYNYSCEGLNAAGWGPRSEDRELIVHYEPGPATLTYFPPIAVKKKSVIFSCSVDDPGYPDTNRFVTKQTHQNTQFMATSHPVLIAYNTVQAMQSNDGGIALESLLTQKQHEMLKPNASLQTTLQTLISSYSGSVENIKETHALIDLYFNHSLCTLLTFTTQSQILALYTGAESKHIISSSSYALYRKMGKFSFVAQSISKPNRYRWLRGGRGPLQDIVTKDWTVEPVGLDSRTNYSCYAYNEGGKGLIATVNLKVHAPPFFIKNLPPYTGILHSTSNATLTCRIECVPRCDISWLKDGVPIEKNDSRYFIKDKYMDASSATGDFESMLSVLHFNTTNWPLNKFDIEADNANYTCMSTANSVGSAIKSSTYLSIEYPPDKTSVSEKMVHVEEDTIPGRIICKSKANPEPSYRWIFKNETIANGNALIINSGLKRDQKGIYTCVAYNKHGQNTAETEIDVQFKPSCTIERQEIDDQDTLICTAFGNPVEADFNWSIKSENETIDTLGSGDKKEFLEKSFYVLSPEYSISRTYRCEANNTVGLGIFCELEVAEQLTWWQRWENTTLIVVVAAILIILLSVIVICCIIICICRRRRHQDKYLTEVSVSATQSVLSYQPVSPQTEVTLSNENKSAAIMSKFQTSDETRKHQHPSTSVSVNVPKSPPRWPLRPGVMVHVNNDTKENLTVNRMTLKQKQLPGKEQLSPQSNDTFDFFNKRISMESPPKLSLSQKPQLKITKLSASEKSLSHLVEKSATETISNKAMSSSSVAQNKIKRIITSIFERAKSHTGNCRDSQRSHVDLLPDVWLARTYSKTTSHHQLNGIRSSGSVTYKKYPQQKHNSKSFKEAETTVDTMDISCLKNAGCSESIPFRITSEKKNPVEAIYIVQSKISQNEHSLKVPQSKRINARLRCTHLLPRETIHVKARPSYYTCISTKINDSENTFSLMDHINKPNKIHDKSSSLGEPLTEPGEYENLPFHGLQTAPKKLSKVPKNVNDIEGTSGSSPHKRLNEDIHQPLDNHQQLTNVEHHNHTLDLNNCNQLEQSMKNTIVNTVNCKPLTSKYGEVYSTNDIMTQQTGNNLGNCFFVSYNEYPKDVPFHQAHDNSISKCSTHQKQLLGAIDQDYQPTHTTVEHIPCQLEIASSNSIMVAKRINKSELKFQGANKLRKQFGNIGLCPTSNICSLPRSHKTPLHKGNCRYSADLCKQQSGPFANTNESLSKKCSTVATAQLHPHPLQELEKVVFQSQKRFHHPTQHVNVKKNGNYDSNMHLIELESLSIYRSDSGISNSSHESQFPVAATEMQQLKCSKTEIKNTNTNQQQENKKVYQCEPSYQSAPSQNNSELKAMPSSTSVDITETTGTAALLHCNTHQNPTQSNIYNTSIEKIQTYQTDNHTFSYKKQIKQSDHDVTSSKYEKNKIPDTNQLLVNFKKSNFCKKNVRRKTIGDPFVHIHRQPYTPQSMNINYPEANSNRLSSSNKLKSPGIAVKHINNNIEYTESKKVMLDATQNFTITTKDNLAYLPTKLPKSTIRNTDPDILDQADRSFEIMVDRRPARLPLHKHHTFHFQNTQTANSKLQKLRKKLQDKQKEGEKIDQNERPFIFQQLAPDGNHAFKPIFPTKTGIKSFQCESTINGDQDEDLGYSFSEEEYNIDNDLEQLAHDY